MKKLLSFFFEDSAGILTGMFMITCMVTLWYAWYYTAHWIDVIVMIVLLLFTTIAHLFLLMVLFQGMQRMVTLITKKKTPKEINPLASIFLTTILLTVTGVLIRDFSFEHEISSPVIVLVGINNVYLSISIWINECIS